MDALELVSRAIIGLLSLYSIKYGFIGVVGGIIMMMTVISIPLGIVMIIGGSILTSIGFGGIIYAISPTEFHNRVVNG
jgi:hypothetical protein